SNCGIPPQGEVGALQAYVREHGLPCPVHTFAFGTQCNHSLLKQIANATSGSFGYIPDSSFLGTIMVNALANFLVTAATEVALVLRRHPTSGDVVRLPLGS